MSQVEVLLKDISERDYALEERIQILTGFDQNNTNMLKANRNAFELIRNFLYEAGVDASVLDNKIKLKKTVEIADDILWKKPSWRKRNDSYESANIMHYKRDKTKNDYINASVGVRNDITDWFNLDRKKFDVSEDYKEGVKKEIYQKLGIPYEEPESSKDAGKTEGASVEVLPKTTSSGFSYDMSVEIFKRDIREETKASIILDNIKRVLETGEREGKLKDTAYRKLRDARDHFLKNIDMKEIISIGHPYRTELEKIPFYL